MSLLSMLCSPMACFQDVVLDSGEEDVAYCVNPGRTWAGQTQTFFNG
jgi:hypothetical protein